MSTPSYELRNQSRKERKTARLSLGVSAAVGIGGGLALATGLPVLAAASGLVGAVALGGVSWRKYTRSNALSEQADRTQQEAWDRRSSLPQNYGSPERSRINPEAFCQVPENRPGAPKPKP